LRGLTQFEARYEPRSDFSGGRGLFPPHNCFPLPPSCQQQPKGVQAVASRPTSCSPSLLLKVVFRGHGAFKRGNFPPFPPPGPKHVRTFHFLPKISPQPTPPPTGSLSSAFRAKCSPADHHCGRLPPGELFFPTLSSRFDYVWPKPRPPPPLVPRDPQ